MLTVGSLFAGIGGFDLGLERAGMQVKWQVEIDPYCLKVLEKHWPHVRRYTDIKTVDWSGVEPVDLVCGGFPCQDISVAGKRAGIDGERSGLWSEYVRCIRALRPRYIFVENVPGLLDNPAMGRVLGDLADSGYDAEWQIISARSVGAPHLRKRVWIVAYPSSLRHNPGYTTSILERQQSSDCQQPRDRRTSQISRGSSSENVAYPISADGGGGTATGRSRNEGRRTSEARGTSLQSKDRQARSSDTESGSENVAYPHQPRSQGRDGGEDVPESMENAASRGRYSQSLRCPSTQTRDSSIDANRPSPTERRQAAWEPEPNVGRVAHGVPSRVDRLRSLGNAVVPQVVEWIGRQILHAEERKP